MPILGNVARFFETVFEICQPPNESSFTGKLVSLIMIPRVSGSNHMPPMRDQGSMGRSKRRINFANFTPK